MSKSKKHVPIQTDDETLVEQVPDDKMDELIRGLADLIPVSVPDQEVITTLPPDGLPDFFYSDPDEDGEDK